MRCTGVQRILMMTGLALLLAGLCWPWLSKLPLGRLPGDIVYESEHLRLYLPITSMLLLSALLSLAAWLWRRG